MSKEDLENSNPDLTPPSIELVLGDSLTWRPETPIDVIITDPPYALDKNGNMLGHLSPNHKEKASHMRGYIDNDREVYAEFLDKFFKVAYDILPENGLLLSFMGNRTSDQLLTAETENGFTLMDIIVFAGGSSFAKSQTTLVPRHELCAFFRKEGSPKKKVNESWKVQNVFTSIKTKEAKLHPTGKPLEWMDFLVETFSFPGETIYDPFAGSGTTLVSARRLGRDAIGVERDPEYYEEAKAIIGEDQDALFW